MIEVNPGLTLEGLARLQTVARKGVERAGRGLSEMAGSCIEVSVPDVRVVSLCEVPHLVGGAENHVVGVYLSILGDLSGHIMLFLPVPSAFALVDALLEQQEGTTAYLDEIAESALAEVGNITGSFFLNALGDEIGMQPQPSPPAVAVDMVGAILDAVLSDLGQYGEDVFMIDTVFRQSDKEISGFFLVLPHRASLEAILRRLLQ
ncbi:MAG: chemotaxis protein CheC [Chloroflexota bacterium]